MEKLLEGPNKFGAQLGRGLTPEPMLAPAAGSLALHGALAGVLLAYGILGGLFHHSQWGNPGSGGAIQVSLTSALPLPSDQPPNQNVLATDMPSQAPAEPEAKTRQAEDLSAIEIAGKQKKPQPHTAARVPKSQIAPQPSNKAQYGEQAGSSIARSLPAQTAFTSGQTAIGDADFGSRFGYYVANINRTMGANWYKPEVNSATPKGARVYLVFTIQRDGTATDVKIAQPSGSPTLDRSCLRGAQRVDTFGQLPSAYNSSTLNVSYYCEY